MIERILETEMRKHALTERAFLNPEPDILEKETPSGISFFDLQIILNYQQLPRIASAPGRSLPSGWYRSSAIALHTKPWTSSLWRDRYL